MSQRLTLMVAGSPDQRTGGYLYDARIVAELRQQGWDIEVVGLEGRFPDADDTAQLALETALAQLPEGHSVVIDGLAMGSLPEVIKRHQPRLAITALVHHPLGDEQGMSSDEQARLHRLELNGLASVRQVIVTSAFTQRRLEALAAHYQLALPGISVVEPGVTPVAEPQHARHAKASTPMTLLCVATLTPRKGQDLLVKALSRLSHLEWQCICQGSLSREPAFADKVAALVEHHSLGERFLLPGECDQAELEAAYQNADALVLPSWYEGYGMVVSEALAHGLPVITTTGGALADTLPDGAGIAVPPGDVDALSAAIERFLEEPALRESLTQGAAAARQQLASWQDAARAFAATLAMPAGSRFEADWLALREPLDVDARSQRLAGFAADWLKASTQAPRLVDLGCGRGSNLCFLARRWPGPQHWLLVDHDPQLLGQARHRGGMLRDTSGQPVTLQTACFSLSELTARWPQQAHLIAASALIDLVSREWIEQLVDGCASHGQALLVALSVTGDWHLTDAAGHRCQQPEDDTVRELFVAHQQRNKGLGAALGGQAHDVLVNCLQAAGFRVEEASTPWQLEAGHQTHRGLLMELVKGWAEAAREQAPDAAAQIDHWCEQRLQAVEDGLIGARVAHRDLFATPPVTEASA
ncbi:MAG: glycosyltransferase [Halomonas sp.]|nr:glycosyltransferase [Halomonas sp.]TVM07269.1 MAG: glycosyltransferase [Halomonas sp.]